MKWICLTLAAMLVAVWVWAEGFTPGSEYHGTPSGTWNPGTVLTGNPSFYAGRDIVVVGTVRSNEVAVFLDGTGRKVGSAAVDWHDWGGTDVVARAALLAASNTAMAASNTAVAASNTAVAASNVAAALFVQATNVAAAAVTTAQVAQATLTAALANMTNASETASNAYTVATNALQAYSVATNAQTIATNSLVISTNMAYAAIVTSSLARAYALSVYATATNAAAIASNAYTTATNAATAWSTSTNAYTAATNAYKTATNALAIATAASVTGAAATVAANAATVAADAASVASATALGVANSVYATATNAEVVATNAQAVATNAQAVASAAQAAAGEANATGATHTAQIDAIATTQAAVTVGISGMSNTILAVGSTGITALATAQAANATGATHTAQIGDIGTLASNALPRGSSLNVGALTNAPNGVWTINGTQDVETANTWFVINATQPTLIKSWNGSSSVSGSPPAIHREAISSTFIDCDARRFYDREGHPVIDLATWFKLYDYDGNVVMQSNGTTRTNFADLVSNTPEGIAAAGGVTNGSPVAVAATNAQQIATNAQQIATNSLQPFQAWTATLTPPVSDGTSTLVYAHGTLPFLSCTGAQMIAWDTATGGWLPGGINRQRLAFWAGSWPVTIQSNASVTWASAISVSSTKTNHIVANIVAGSGYTNVVLYTLKVQ
jgi:hypothetical protein